MAGLPELLNFVTKFSNLWKSNKSARLAAECHGGKATVSLHLQLGALTPEEVYQPPPPRPSPSRLRRRARRAQARAEAAANAANTASTAVEAAKLTDTAVQTVDKRTTLVDNSVQAVSATKEVAVQAVPPQEPVPPPRHVPAVSAERRPHLPHVPAVSAGQPQLHQAPVARAAHPRLHHVQAGHAAPHLHYQARHLPQDGVQDVFCPDDEYNDEEYNRNRANVRNTLQMIEDALNYSR